MFTKVLVANRGEIACRVIGLARRLGIATVAVHSTADTDALHVSLADEAICIGPPPATESYLSIEAILRACRETGAQAVHPGYGFLSENAEFAEALADAGVQFVGPPAEAIRAMGDKITAKGLAEQAGVNTIPGHSEVVEDTHRAREIARSIGYPVMIKATAGGGGKGMRIAYDDTECLDGFERATSEAHSSFGDGRVFIEKYIEKPRHIEIQVLADKHGKVIHLGERECSLQRRHQKIIEESPSPFLLEETRQAMGSQAVQLARAVNYSSAGTVEFIVDAEQRFYFLEMNTRLQVEHPVTECVSGLDLVELMLRVAAGEPLALEQSRVVAQGWAMEARVYAENPSRGFLPSTGRLVRYREPASVDGVRVDSGVCEGAVVSMHYDPMIAKLITHGDSREAARQRMRDALDQFVIRGVSHNIPFLQTLASHPRFAEGDFDTDFVGAEYPEGFDPGRVQREDERLLPAIAACAHRRDEERRSALSGQLSRRSRRLPPRWVVLLAGRRYEVEVPKVAAEMTVMVDGHRYRLGSDWELAEPALHLVVDGRPTCVQIEREGPDYRLSHAGAVVLARVLSPRSAALSAHMREKQPPDLSRYLLAPMPGLLVSIAVSPGQTFKAGEELAIVEAMKMENTLRAGNDGRVSEWLASPGDSLRVDQPIMAFE